MKLLIQANENALPILGIKRCGSHSAPFPSSVWRGLALLHSL